MLKKCIICGKVFTPKNSQQITCSLECKKIRLYETQMAWREKNEGKSKEYERNRALKSKKKKSKKISHVLDDELKSLQIYNEKHGVRLSYGQWQTRRLGA